MHKILLIQNLVNFHNETIESYIVKYKEIFHIDYDLDIYIDMLNNSLNNNNFKKYIKEKYNNIIFDKPINYDYYINCTIYDRHYNNILDNPNYIYISHHITERLKKKNNVFFLTPLMDIKNYISCDILPYMNYKIKTNIPIYVIQGNLETKRRNYSLLEKILSKEYDYEFKIKLVGRGIIPNKLKKFSNKIILKNNLLFIDYHKEFSDCYCLLPLITKKSHPQYYTTKLTSSINYAKAYKLLTIIDKDLQEIYNLDNVEIFNDENDIVTIFEKTLINFYKQT